MPLTTKTLLRYSSLQLLKANAPFNITEGYDSITATGQSELDIDIITDNGLESLKFNETGRFQLEITSSTVFVADADASPGEIDLTESTFITGNPAKIHIIPQRAFLVVRPLVANENYTLKGYLKQTFDIESGDILNMRIKQNVSTVPIVTTISSRMIITKIS